MFGGGRKDKGFSSKSKVQHYHSDGTETIIMMGKPFRVLQKLSDAAAPYMPGGANRRRTKHVENDHESYVFLVENSSRLSEFPRHLALKRSFYPVDQVQEAHKEIEVMSRIKDKNIVRVYHSEISRSEGKLGVSIAMEYCGNNLYRRIRSGSAGGAGTRLSESEICHILLAMTSALGYLHSQQPPIAHRDIRPENVLINNNNTGAAAYKLCNFSSATTDAYHCESREEASMAINDIELHTNPAFRSPEMADPWSKKRICEKSDMWSLGVLLYFMMFLKLPFEPTNMALSNNPKVRFPTSDASRYCGSLRLITEHLLDPNPDTRWDVFALTNFLRFDEDVSRHLGTFCFTRTEYPEGWEEQDVKVLNRDPLPKPPPVSYGGEQGHITVEDDRKAGEARRAAVAAGNGRGDDESPVNRPGGAGGAARALGGGGTSDLGDDAVREAMMVLGGGDDDDPEMVQYREMIIREQKEVWARLKAQAGRSDDAPRGNGNEDNHTAGAAAATATATTASPPAEEPKKDLFDDLFAGPAQPPQQQPQAASSSASPNPQGQPPQQQQQQPPPQKDVFSADDLFSAPPPPQPQQQGYGMQPQQQGYNASNNMYGDGGGWGTGMPVNMGGVYTPQQQQQQQQQPQQWNVGGEYPKQQQQQGGGGWGGNGYGSTNTANSGMSGGYPQQQQVNQGSYNFMAPPPGQQQQPPQQQNVAPPETAVLAKKKDPFADLFS